MKITIGNIFLTALFGTMALQGMAQPKKSLPNKHKAMDTLQTATTQGHLTTDEREYASRLLQETETGVFGAVNGLNQAQLVYKPATGKWSVEECVKHIAAAEQTLWAMAEALLQQPANPDKRAEIKYTDQQLVKAVEDRTHKSTTFKELEPANAPYKSMDDALRSFKQNREKLIAFVGSTKEDLRNHVLALPIGTYDAYQFILLIAAHSNRHTQQIEEVMASAGFPDR